MKVKGFILYKTREFVEARLVIKSAIIKEISLEYFTGLYPEENNSSLSKINELKETHDPDRIQNGCKYYIQHSIEGEVMNIYLDINLLQYWKLRWQLFKEKYLKTKEFIVGLILAVIATLLTLLITKD